MPKSIHRAEYEVMRRMLRQIREESGLTQVEMSARLGRDQVYISNIERGVRRIDLVELRDLCVAAKIDLASFVGRFEGRLREQGLGK